MWTDNQTCVTCLRSGKSRNPFLAACSRELWHICATEDIDLLFSHIPGADNQTADLLSRQAISPADRLRYQAFTDSTTLRQAPIAARHLLIPDSQPYWYFYTSTSHVLLTYVRTVTTHLSLPLHPSSRLAITIVPPSIGASLLSVHTVNSPFNSSSQANTCSPCYYLPVITMTSKFTFGYYYSLAFHRRQPPLVTLTLFIWLHQSARKLTDTFVTLVTVPIGASLLWSH